MERKGIVRNQILINRKFSNDSYLRSKPLAITSIVPPTRIPQNEIDLLSPADDGIFTGTSSNPLSIVISHFSLCCGIAHTCFAGFTLGFSPSACCMLHLHLNCCLPLFLTYCWDFHSNHCPQSGFSRRISVKDVQSVEGLCILRCWLFITRDWRHQWTRRPLVDGRQLFR